MSEHVSHPLYDCGGKGHGSDVSEVQWCHDCNPHEAAALDVERLQKALDAVEAKVGFTVYEAWPNAEDLAAEYVRLAAEPVP